MPTQVNKTAASRQPGLQLSLLKGVIYPVIVLFKYFKLPRSDKIIWSPPLQNASLAASGAVTMWKHVRVWKAVTSVEPGGKPEANCLCNYTFEVQEVFFYKAHFKRAQKTSETRVMTNTALRSSLLSTFIRKREGKKELHCFEVINS